MPASIVIARRFRGPRDSANGGYASGLLAASIPGCRVGGGGAEVTLRLPPPLDRPLEIVADGERMLLLDGDALVAEAIAADPDVTPPPVPGFEAAVEASHAAVGWGAPEFDECYVCGTRREGDGLEIHAGRVGGRDDGLVATTWVAGDVRPEVVWAVIDCPGAYALRGEGRGDPLLARITARVDRLPRNGERCVVAAWPLEADGRKRNAATALIGEDGDVLAVSRQLWIEPRETPASG
jgi:hypothetical protein